jgi:hypothetical protein
MKYRSKKLKNNFEISRYNVRNDSLLKKRRKALNDNSIVDKNDKL